MSRTLFFDEIVVWRKLSSFLDQVSRGKGSNHLPLVRSLHWRQTNGRDLSYPGLQITSVDGKTWAVVVSGLQIGQ